MKDLTSVGTSGACASVAEWPQSSTVWCVGGGPSLRGFPWEVLRGQFCIAVNRAFEVLPWAQIVYFSDARFWAWYSDRLLQHPGIKVTLQGRLFREHESVRKLRATGRGGVDWRPGCLRTGNCSGYAAINLALHCGAKRVLLLGYDMQAAPDGALHWHEEHPVPTRLEALERMQLFFRTLQAALRGTGVQVQLVRVGGVQSALSGVFEEVELEHALAGA